MFSKACEHGIKAMIYIGICSLEGKRVKIGDIVRNSGSPEAFTAKVLGALTKEGIVNSHTGPNGGFDISSDQMKKIRICDIVFAIDGDAIYNGCGLGLSECDHTKPCPMHEKFVKIRNQLKEMLETISIYDLTTGLKSGKTILMR
jgi:Rrf2 family iron-sulfur cluster assembly transcriptional regulator